ncbi:MAG: hypothetical protein H6R37_1381, partial [Deltaproteobacteria bacterium]|nr:hypothetical protein [Deltaproteobacteria bacterium]
KQCGDAQAKVDTLTKENAELKGMMDKLKAQLADVQKTAGGAQVPGKSVPSVPAKKP